MNLKKRYVHALKGNVLIKSDSMIRIKNISASSSIKNDELIHFIKKYSTFNSEAVYILIKI